MLALEVFAKESRVDIQRVVKTLRVHPFLSRDVQLVRKTKEGKMAELLFFPFFFPKPWKETQIGAFIALAGTR